MAALADESCLLTRGEDIPSLECLVERISQRWVDV
jgi:hypothetical protein